MTTETPDNLSTEDGPPPVLALAPRLAVPKDWRTHYRGKGCQCAAHDQSECVCDADWTDSEIYLLRNTINELLQCVTTDHESKADFIARVNAILSANTAGLPRAGNAATPTLSNQSNQ